MANMSSTLPQLQTGSGDPVASLAALRLELDRLDDALHDLLMQRANVVERVAALGAKGRVALRPGREADIIRRLLRRHQGKLPRQVLPRIWRELFAATTAMQGPYSISVCEVQPSGGFVAAAREHFGASTPLRAYRSPAQAIGEVSAGHAIAVVLPMPAEEEAPQAAWWTSLLSRDEPRIHVVARLPFWSARAEGAPRTQALVLAAVPPDASLQDRSLVGLELPLEMSRARLSAVLTEAGFALGGIILRRDAAHAVALVDVDGYVSDADPRLAKLMLPRQPVVLGAYAISVDGDFV